MTKKIVIWRWNDGVDTQPANFVDCHNDVIQFANCIGFATGWTAYIDDADTFEDIESAKVAADNVEASTGWGSVGIVEGNSITDIYGFMVGKRVDYV